MDCSPIAARHTRMIRLIEARDAVPLGEGLLRTVRAFDHEIDELQTEILGIPIEGPVDAMHKLDVVVPLLEAAHDDLKGSTRAAVAAALVAIAAAASALTLAGGEPLRNEGTTSGLLNFACLAQRRYPHATAH
jgi:hypothetical protein